MTVIEELTRNVDPVTGITIVQTFCGVVTHHPFRTADEALVWMQKSVFDHIESDVPKGSTMTVKIVGQLNFVVRKTDEESGSRCTYE